MAKLGRDAPRERGGVFATCSRHCERAERPLPFSPCGRRCRSEAEADEGYISAREVCICGENPSSGASRHLLPQGEKEAACVGWVERKRNPSPMWMEELMGIASLHSSYECHPCFPSRPASIASICAAT